ncbi:Hematopoietic lineage cell-specific protein [Sparganum proliferum]
MVSITIQLSVFAVLFCGELIMGDDDWDESPDFKIEMTEQEQRWGSKAIPGTGRVGHIDMQALRESVLKQDAESKQNVIPKASYGYGGKFQVEKDRMDKSAVGHDYHEELQKHSSQQDYSKGFGGRYGVETDRQDKSAVGYEHREEMAKHSSQKDYSYGFGGKYGIQKDRRDASSLDYTDREESVPHESQQPKPVTPGGTSASALRAKFEAMMKENQKPAERPARPIGRISKDAWKPTAQTEPVKSTPQPTAIPKAEEKPAVEPPTQPKREATPPPPVEQPVAKEEPQPEAPKSESPKMALPVMRRPPSPGDSDWSDSEAQLQPVSESTEQAIPTTQSSDAPAKPSCPEPEPPQPSDAGCTAVALYDFTGKQDDELTMKAGEVITDINKFHEEWWEGRIGDRFGIFPAVYVAEA